MNASRLMDALEILIHNEDTYRIQDILNELQSHLVNLVNAPQESSHQNQFSDSLKKLNSTLNQMGNGFDPAQISLFKDIGAIQFFSADIPNSISQYAQENPITPAVVRDFVADIIDKRNSYIDRIKNLRNNLVAIGVQSVELEPGSAEIGFVLPRDLFDGQLQLLIKQLGVVNSLIRGFSEFTTGSVQPIAVRQISSSDPLFFFCLDVRIIATIGAAVTWALHTWKQVEEIREIRERSSEIPSFTDSDLKVFDDRIEEVIEAAIKEKVSEIHKESQERTTRTSPEQQTHITWALRTLLALVERGLKVEIRALPSSNRENESDIDPEIESAFEQISENGPELIFPEIEGRPVLDLPAPLNEKEHQKDKSPQARSTTKRTKK